MRKSKASQSSLRVLAYIITAGAVLAALMALDRALPSVVNPYYMRMVMLSGIAIILAVSLNLVNGFAGQFSLGHAGFYAIGAYSSAVLTHYWGSGIVAWLTTALGLPLSVSTVIMMLLAIVVAVVASAAAGLIVGLPSLRLRGDYLAIATLGFGEAIRVIIQNSETVGAQRGFRVESYTTFTSLFALVILVIVFSRNLALSSHGRALFAIRDDEVAAEAAGVAVFRYKVTVFAMSAAWAGVAGALFAHYEMYLVPKTFDFMKSVDIVVMVVLGGGGSITGSVIAAVALTSLPMLLQNYLPGDIQNLRMVVYAVLLVVLMLTRPRGIFGRAELSLMAPAKRLLRKLRLHPPEPHGKEHGG